MAITTNWVTRTPLVLDDISLAAFVDTVLSKHGPSSILLVCSTRETFKDELVASIINESTATADTNPTQHHLLVPTLHLLSSSRTLKAVFCPEVPHLLAYLAQLSLSSANLPASAMPPLLAILNPLRQHQDTLSFSAQGLGRFFSTATHTAHTIGAKLIIAECPPLHDDEDEDLLADPSFAEARSPWDNEVGMVNVTTKTFGAGDPGWQGRTVTLRQIASRWCSFA